MLKQNNFVSFPIPFHRGYDTCLAHAKHYIRFLRNRLFGRELETATQRLSARDRGIYSR